ncbi:MAG: alpha-L-glutamate ligase, RimK family, partial [Frankiales bacterium]|nr:alpha-L-glutamate ligase, RimK family [Frankiales bacterium]
VLDLPTLCAEVSTDGTAEVRDRHGVVEVSHLAPALLYWQEAAATAYRLLELRGVRVLNGVAASEVADDKGRTAVALVAAGVSQVASTVVPQDRERCARAAERTGYPVVLKRTHGAQGRWVRAARDHAELDAVLDLFATEGRGAVVVQPLVAGAAGASLRLVVVDDRVVACTRRQAPDGELQSNVSAGGSQQLHVPTPAEAELAVAATRAVGLRFAGVDLLEGPLVLEVNAAPDFTSMRTHVPVDVAREVLLALLRD